MSNNPMTQIHGHEIIRLVHGARPPLTRVQLLARAATLFGADARFRTCSAENMTIEQLLAFLASRGKVIERDGRMVADVGQMCSSEEGPEHDHDHAHDDHAPAAPGASAH